MKDALVAKKQKGRPKKESKPLYVVDTRDLKQKAYDLFSPYTNVFDCYQTAGSLVMKRFLEQYPSPIPFHLFRYLSQKKMIQFFATNEQGDMIQKGDLVFYYQANIFHIALLHLFNKNNGTLYILNQDPSIAADFVPLKNWYCFGRIAE